MKNVHDIDMTLRDYFAAKAMQSGMNSYPGRHEQDLVESAYKTADAMMQERARRIAEEQNPVPKSDKFSDKEIEDWMDRNDWPGSFNGAQCTMEDAATIHLNSKGHDEQ